jgi:hypothetical protein
VIIRNGGFCEHILEKLKGLNPTNAFFINGVGCEPVKFFKSFRGIQGRWVIIHAPSGVFKDLFPKFHRFQIDGVHVISV